MREHPRPELHWRGDWREFRLPAELLEHVGRALKRLHLTLSAPARN